eukprot:gene13537-28704_t
MACFSTYNILVAGLVLSGSVVLVAVLTNFSIHQQNAHTIQHSVHTTKHPTDKDNLINDPDYNRRRSIEAFLETERWRAVEVPRIYADVTDEELDLATRWLGYAEPFASYRSCPEFTNASIFVKKMISLRDHLNFSKPQGVCTSAIKKYLAINAFHTTGIEGNTLTLPETFAVVNGIKLFAGYDRDHVSSPLAIDNVLQVESVLSAFDALNLSVLISQPKIIWTNLTSYSLIDLQSIIVRGTTTPVGFRRYGAAIGHQRIILPMPDEIPYLIDKFLERLNGDMTTLLDEYKAGLAYPMILSKALDISCSAHTTFVHIHPFADGNGRLTRLLSGIVLDAVGLPAPLFERERRLEYISAVGNATIHRNYSHICIMHHEAVMLALKTAVAAVEEDL